MDATTTPDFDWDTPGPFDDLYAAIDEVKLIAVDLAVTDRLIAGGLMDAYASLVAVRNRIVAEYSEASTDANASLGMSRTTVASRAVA